MINQPPPFKGFNTRISIIIPNKGRGFINQGSGLVGSYLNLIMERKLRTTECQGNLWVNNSYDHYSILTYLS